MRCGQCGMLRPLGLSSVKNWTLLLLRFSAGQGAILGINLITGFLILRLLSVNEYAIYIIASMLQTVVSLGTDRGMSQGLVTIGAPIREDRLTFGALVASALRLRRKLFLFVVPFVLAIAYVLLRGIEIRVETALPVVALALANGWVQQSGQVATAVLNANHDSAGLLRAGAGGALVRLVLVQAVCGLVPLAAAALAVNLIGSSVHTGLMWRRCRRHVVVVTPMGRDYSEELFAFMRPLLPGIIYYLLQGHIATFLLVIAGLTNAVAELGALGRLAQIVGLMMLLNGFFIQPYFARIQSRAQYARRAAQAILLLCMGSAVITLSGVLWPEAWVAILGPKYEGLASDLVLALIGAQLSVAGAMLYTIVIATRRTSGQWLQILLGVGAQLLFLAFADVNSTRAALILSMLPAATYVVLQIGLLAYGLAAWRGSLQDKTEPR